MAAAAASSAAVGLAGARPLEASDAGRAVVLLLASLGAPLFDASYLFVFLMPREMPADVVLLQTAAMSRLQAAAVAVLLQAVLLLEANYAVQAVVLLQVGLAALQRQAAAVTLLLQALLLAEAPSAVHAVLHAVLQVQAAVVGMRLQLEVLAALQAVLMAALLDAL